MQDANAYDERAMDEECDDEVDGNNAIEEFKINDLLTVRLDYDEPRMYVNGRPFDQCAYPVLNDVSESERDDKFYGETEPLSVPRKATRSVDAFLWKEHGTLDHPGYVEESHVSPQELFWGLCSTLQAWAENDYDTRLLHVNLAFPLARALADAGDLAAKATFEREVVARWKSDFYPVQAYLLHGGFLNHLTPWALVDIIAHGGPQDLIRNLYARVDARTLGEAWKGQKACVQLRILEQFHSIIEQMDPSIQSVMVAGCASIKVGAAIMRFIDARRFTDDQMRQLKGIKRSARIIEEHVKGTSGSDTSGNVRNMLLDGR